MRYSADAPSARSDENGDLYADVNLLGDDAIASSDAINDMVVAALLSGDVTETLRRTLRRPPDRSGIYTPPARYTFQAHQIAQRFDVRFHLRQGHRQHERALHSPRG